MKGIEKVKAIQSVEDESQGIPFKMEWYPHFEEKDVVTIFSQSGIAHSGYALGEDNQDIETP